MSANNHYAGFGQGTVNIFRKMVGLPEAAYSKDEDDKSHLLVVVAAFNAIIQSKVPFQIL